MVGELATGSEGVSGYGAGEGGVRSSLLGHPSGPIEAELSTKTTHTVES